MLLMKRNRDFSWNYDAEIHGEKKTLILTNCDPLKYYKSVYYLFYRQKTTD